MVNKYSAEGYVDELSGRTRQTVGSLTDDRNLENRGTAQRLAGQARRVYGQARDTVGDAADTMGRAVSDRPFPAVMIAAALGFILGMIAFRGDDRDDRWSARRRAL